MKYIYLIFSLLFVFYCKGQVISISQVLAIPTQTINANITLANGIMSLSSPPYQTSDIYLQQNGYRIYTDYFDLNQIYPLNNPTSAHTDSLNTDFTIPALAPLGWYEVHVISYIYDPLNPLSPGTPVDNILNYGLVVHDPASCELPSGTSASAITNTSAQINWNPIVADTFRIRYYINGTLNYLYKDVNGTGGVSSAVLNNLLPGATYNFEISTICLGIHSTYSIINNFTTLTNPASCIIPLLLNSSSVTNTSAIVSWSPNVISDSFRIRYWKAGAIIYQYKGVSGTSYSFNLTNLQPNTLYNYQVRSVCVSGSTSYSNVATFTTLNLPVGCIIPYGESVSSLTNTSALVSWNSLVTADTFRIRYSINGNTNYQYVNSPGTAGNSSSINNLLPNTTYHLRISSICSGSSSGYGPVVVFNTASGSVACTVPYGLASTNITLNSANISWTPLVTADSFLIRYSVSGTTNYIWKKISGAGGVSSSQLTGLSNVTTYQWQVRSICVGVPAGPYSVSYVFTTPLVKLANKNPIPENSIQVYPNPANDKIFINCTTDFEGRGEISLFDLSGRLILYQAIAMGKGENDFTLPLETIQPGCYFISVEAGNIRKLTRVVVE